MIQNRTNANWGVGEQTNTNTVLSNAFTCLTFISLHFMAQEQILNTIKAPLHVSSVSHDLF
jgi:hypothetical protein